MHRAFTKILLIAIIYCDISYALPGGVVTVHLPLLSSQTQKKQERAGKRDRNSSVHIWQSMFQD